MKASRSLLSILLIVILVMSFAAMALAQDLEIIPIKIRARAKPPMENWRGLNFLVAERDLNADLEAIGDPRRVKVEIIQDNMEWGPLVTEFVLAYGVGEAPDIWLTGHEYIGAQAEAGRIIPLGGMIEEFPIFNLVFDNLWVSTMYKGKIWGVPQDAEARPLYWNKLLLKQVGWSNEEIAALPGKIEKGEFTLYDMLETAKQAVDKGVVKPGNGFWTRPKNGPDFTPFYYAFGGETINPATGELVYNKTAGLKYYKFFYEAAQEYGSMGCLGLDWSEAWHPGVSGGKVLFWVGGTWQWSEWAEKYLKDLGGEAYMWENLGFGLIPAAEKGGKPNSLTHPMAFLVSSQCKHPDLAVALIAKVTNYGPNTRHAIASTHLGILKGQTEYKFYKGSRLLSEALYMLDYTTFLPNSPDWGTYSNITYEAMAACVSGDFTPEEAVDFVVEELNRELGDKITIK
jgi:inositol-phosphate transport system substrate-binding protein